MATAKFEEIVEDFGLLDEWQDRYRYVIDLGKVLDPFPEELRLAETKVDGCASQVWIHAQVRNEAGQRYFFFIGDSDAIIVRGLIAVLMTLYNGLPPERVATLDARAELDRIGLRNHLSSQRSNGLTAMVSRIQRLATEIIGGSIN